MAEPVSSHNVFFLGKLLDRERGGWGNKHFRGRVHNGPFEGKLKVGFISLDFDAGLLSFLKLSFFKSKLSFTA